MLVQWGFKKIYLLGIDMKWGTKTNHGKHKRQTHWHDGHRRIDGEATYKGMIQNWKEIAPKLKAKGVQIININDSSNLQGYPMKTYEEMFGPHWQIPKEERVKRADETKPIDHSPKPKPKRKVKQPVRKPQPPVKKLTNPTPTLGGSNLVIKTR